MNLFSIFRKYAINITSVKLSIASKIHNFIKRFYFETHETELALLFGNKKNKQSICLTFCLSLVPKLQFRPPAFIYKNRICSICIKFCLKEIKRSAHFCRYFQNKTTIWTNFCSSILKIYFTNQASRLRTTYAKKLCQVLTTVGFILNQKILQNKK